MAIGENHSCGMISGNVLKCWGSNGDDQLGQPDITYSTTPQVVVFASSNYTYGTSAHDHAVTALSSGESYGYDANGNTLAPDASAGVISRTEGGVSYTQTFDAENRLISITAGGLTTQFLYDGDGNMVKKIKTDGSKTIYVGGIYEVDKNSGGSVTGTKTYYPAAGAMRVGSTLYYVLKDHLGSASVVTNTSGTIVGEDRFYPFGETRFTTGTMFTDKLFTGQREITGLGIYHYGARFYSPKLGRFLSADTIVPDSYNPQYLNRFSYVLNNPLRYTDPTGHRACGDEEAISCETGLLNNPSNHTNIGCGNPGQQSCLGNSGNNHDDNNNYGGSNYCDTHPGACGTPTTVPDVITPLEPTPAEGGANDYDPFSTHDSSEETCGHCEASLILGIFSFAEGANLAVVGGAAAYLLITGAPLWAAVIPAAVLVGVALVGVNWLLVGIQEINAGLNPGEHHEIDYLPLVPDAWQK
jgi:RHS repeat-associated protein